MEVWFLLLGANLSIWISSEERSGLHSSPQALGSHVCRTMGALTGPNAKISPNERPAAEHKKNKG